MPRLDSSASAHSRTIRFKHLRLGAIVLGVLVILAFACSSAYDAWRAYRNALVATDRELGNVVKALAEQTASTWEGIDLLLNDTARWYQIEGRKFEPARVDQVLANRAAGVRQVRLLTIVDADGIQRYHSRGSSPPGFSVSDRSYFIAQRDRAATGLFMSEPIVTRTENRSGVVFSRRLDDDKGFAGVVTADVDLEDLQRFYGAVNLGAGSAIELLREDGTLLVRSPPMPGAVGKKFPQLVAAPNVQANRLVNPLDGTRDFMAMARVRNTPLELASRAKRASRWRRGATRPSASACARSSSQCWEC